MQTPIAVNFAGRCGRNGTRKKAVVRVDVCYMLSEIISTIADDLDDLMYQYDGREWCLYLYSIFYCTVNVFLGYDSHLGNRRYLMILVCAYSSSKVWSVRVLEVSPLAIF
uniref:Uncharacterized protein n=1 Tax=Glossina pallidipes TaxID=7398 RepID=A0A1B0AJ50_GLOPL